VAISGFPGFLVFPHTPLCCLFLGRGGGGFVSPTYHSVFLGFRVLSPPTFLLLVFVGILAFLVFLSGDD